MSPSAAPFAERRSGSWAKRARPLGVLGLLGLSVVLLGETSEARPPWYSGGDSRVPYAVVLTAEDGTSLRTFRRAGTTFALGYEGERYDVRIENHTDHRVEAVLTVDGRDAVSGNVGDFSNERGYIVGPYASIKVNGFRRNLDETAAFRFAAPEASYSARRGTPENVGVIGVAFFPERAPFRPQALARPDPWRSSRRYEPQADDSSGEARRSTATREAEPSKSAAGGPLPAGPAPSAAAKRAEGDPGGGSRGDSERWWSDGKDLGWGRARERDASPPSRLGTEYGEATTSHVTQVSFERRNRTSPEAIVTLRYDDADGLISRGIDVYGGYYGTRVATSPDPFPASGFAPPPP